MDLQLFSAQERTEEATPRRLRKAREEGRAARSTDLVAGAGLLAGSLALRGLGPGAYRTFTEGMRSAFGGLEQTDLTVDRTLELFTEWAMLYLRVVVPIIGVILAVGLTVGLLQTGMLLSARPLQPDPSRINPVQGLKRIFSLRTVVEFLKSLAKVAVVGAIAYWQWNAAIPQVPDLMSQSLPAGIAVLGDRSVVVLQSIAMGLLAIGVLDYMYQRYEFRKSLRMTKQEVKQEHKETEGSPEMKSRQRQRARELARRRRALKEVPTADVVVTNPTHYAVALRYNTAEDEAPRVVAKGADLLAQRIKVIAKKHKVPMVENKPLARSLYDMVEVGRTVPPELYTAVAEVLAFVYSLRRQKRRKVGMEDQ